MKIDKAIEILKELKRGLVADEEDAIQLGIEALKSVKQDRVLKLQLPGRLIPLPGETEE